jgi:short-subunit dehydrogenase
VRLEGKTALLTGATGGLGRAIAHSLADRGARLVLSSRRAVELEELAAGLAGDGHETLTADLAEDGAAEALVAEAERSAPIDVLVANAGVPGTGATLDSAAATRVLRLNLEVPTLMAAAALAGMRERDSGHIVFISSLAGKAIPSYSSLYSASKAGLRAFGLGLRDDLSDTGVSVSVVLPGFVRSAGMFASSGAKPPPGLGTAAPADVGRAVADAIEKDRGEVDVAPLQQRLLTTFAFSFHGLASRIERAAGGRRTAEQMADGRGHGAASTSSEEDEA